MKKQLGECRDVRQLGATAAVGAAFQQRAIACAVTSELRASTRMPAKVLVNLVDMGIPYSMQMLAVPPDASVSMSTGKT